MLMKTKEERSDILTNATMLMKTKGLFFQPHDMYESKGTCLKPQGDNRDQGAHKTALPLFHRADQNVGTQGMAGRSRYLSWHGDPGHDLTRAGCPCKLPSAFTIASRTPLSRPVSHCGNASARILAAGEFCRYP